MDLLTLEQIATIEGKGKSYTGYLRRQIKDGHLQSTKLGNTRVVTRADYEAWKATKPVQGQHRGSVKKKRKTAK